MTQKQDTIEAADLAHSYLPIKRCGGNRLVHADYVCSRCGYDFDAYDDEGGRGCNKPRPGYGKEKRKAQRAREAEIDARIRASVTLAT